MGYIDIASPRRRSVFTNAATFSTWLLPAAVVLAAIVVRLHSLENADVTWLLTLAEKLLDGHHDFIEVNPPGAIFTYVPAVWLARLFGIPAEVTCDALVFLVAALSLGSVSLLLGRKFAERHEMPLVIAGAAAILLLLPAHTFGEREHLGVMFILPWTAVLAVRLGGSTPDAWLRVCAGIGCGLCVMIKPHFIVNVGVLLVIVAWRMRTWGLLFAAENCAAALVLLLYGLIVWTKFPDYLVETAPMVAAVYVPDRLDLATLLAAPGSILWAGTIALIITTGALRRDATLPALLLLMSCASYFTFLLQGKGWPYQSYPAISFAMLAVVMQLARNDEIIATRVRLLRVLNVVGALTVFYIGTLWFDIEFPRDTRAIARAINRIAQRPTIAVISDDISIGFPLTRLVHGSWAQRSSALWMTTAVLKRRQPDSDPKTLAAIEGYELLDRSRLRDDIRSNRPEILLVQAKRLNSHKTNSFNWLNWARDDPQFADELNAYKFVEQVDDVQIWRRS